MRQKQHKSRAYINAIILIRHRFYGTNKQLVIWQNHQTSRRQFLKAFLRYATYTTWGEIYDELLYFVKTRKHAANMIPEVGGLQVLPRPPPFPKVFYILSQIFQIELVLQIYSNLNCFQWNCHKAFYFRHHWLNVTHMIRLFDGTSCFHCCLACSQTTLTRRTDNFTGHTIRFVFVHFLGQNGPWNEFLATAVRCGFVCCVVLVGRSGTKGSTCSNKSI